MNEPEEGERQASEPGGNRARDGKVGLAEIQIELRAVDEQVDDADP